MLRCTTERLLRHGYVRCLWRITPNQSLKTCYRSSSSSSSRAPRRGPKFYEGTYHGDIKAGSILSTSGLKLKQRLKASSESPALVLERSIENGDATVERAKICLMEFKERLWRQPRRERRRLISSEKMGSLTLRWLWAEDLRWYAILRDEPHFLELMVMYVVGEGVEKFVVAWLAVSGVDLPEHHRPDMPTDFWRGNLLRALVNAHIALEERSSADRALNLFFQVADAVFEDVAQSKASKQSPTGLGRLWLWPAQVELFSALSTVLFHRTSPQLYDRFISFVETNNKSREMALTLATLHLSHPSRPDPQPLLQLLRTRGDVLSASGISGSGLSTVSANVNLMMTLRRAAALLRLQSRSNDAQWLDDVWDRLFSAVDEATSLKFETKLQQAERRPGWPAKPRR